MFPLWDCFKKSGKWVILSYGMKTKNRERQQWKFLILLELVRFPAPLNAQQTCFKCILNLKKSQHLHFEGPKICRNTPLIPCFWICRKSAVLFVEIFAFFNFTQRLFMNYTLQLQMWGRRIKIFYTGIQKLCLANTTRFIKVVSAPMKWIIKYMSRKCPESC